MSKFVVKTLNLSLIFTENQHLKGFSPIMKAPFQRIKREDTLLHRSFSICCDSKTFHSEIDHLKTILIKSNYPLNFIDLCIKSFINELYTPKVIVPNVPKRNVFVKLAILESTSFQIRKKLKKLFSDKSTSCHLKIVFTSPARVKSFFTFKGKLPKMLLSYLFTSISVVAAILPVMEDQTLFQSPNL